VAVLAVAGGGAAAGVLLTQDSSSGGSGGKARYAYPEAVKSQFLTACETHSQQSQCECIVRAYESTMPYSIYRAIALGGVRFNNKIYFQAFTQAASHCSS
jgi:hypothetical protein